ncbi:fructose PTS transporter subunit IIA [Olsenella urininfantis]|uniref:fructose PTS transporter subunit IIA n=1 Tax=Olsenella urininfantis TaxID=1871033 RepID=UPI000984AC41|nr:fructose PTS transporter subunit IIA [Olsenella urininfantis]
MRDFVKASHVFLDNPAKSVDEALEFLSQKSVELGIADDAQSVLDAFRAREAEGTTGMMEGFAIPHAKTDAIKEAAVLVAKFAGDIEWESMDNKPIKVAIALCVPGGEAGTTHLQLLSKVAIMLMDEGFRASALAGTDEASIAELINGGLD